MYSELSIKSEGKIKHSFFVALTALTWSNKRVRATIEEKKDCLLIKIWASDPVAMRAALNSYLRIISAAREVVLHVFGGRNR